MTSRHDAKKLYAHWLQLQQSLEFAMKNSGKPVESSKIAKAILNMLVNYDHTIVITEVSNPITHWCNQQNRPEILQMIPWMNVFFG